MEVLSGNNYDDALEILKKSVGRGWIDFFGLNNKPVTTKKIEIDLRN